MELELDRAEDGLKGREDDALIHLGQGEVGGTTGGVEVLLGQGEATLLLLRKRVSELAKRRRVGFRRAEVT